MGARNEKVKITFEDKWYRLYTKGAGHRQHKSDKHCNHRKFRRLNKKMIDIKICGYISIKWKNIKNVLK